MKDIPFHLQNWLELTSHISWETSMDRIKSWLSACLLAILFIVTGSA
jgi:hypothetical protein